MPYKEIGLINIPADDIILYRYMSLDKLLNILETQTLFFPSVLSFDDLYEGAYPKNMPDTYDPNKIKYVQQLKRCIRINCWNAYPWENAKMWKEYTNNGDGISIKTNVLNIKESLKGKIDVHIGQINYIDYNGDMFERLSDQSDTNLITAAFHYYPYFHKHERFKDESEVRLVMSVDKYIQLFGTIYFGYVPRGMQHSDYSVEDIINDSEKLYDRIKSITDLGIDYMDHTTNKIVDAAEKYLEDEIQYPIDVNNLIDEIIISPYCQKWQSDLYKSVINKCGYGFKVRDSDLVVSKE